MKLNKRAVLIILPALSVCFLAMLLTVYRYQSQVLLDMKLAQARLEISNLALIVDRYNNFGEDFIASLLKSKVVKFGLSTKKGRYKAIVVERQINATLKQFPSLSFSEFSVLVLAASGEKLLHFEGGDNPFSELDPEFFSRVKEATEKAVKDRRLILEGGKSKLQFVRRINLTTLREPVYQDDDDAVVIALQFDAVKLDNKIKQLINVYGYQVLESALEDEPVVVSGHHVQASAADIVRFTLVIDQSRLETERQTLLLRITAVFIVFVVFVGLVLIGLIRRYITAPIHTLQGAISESIHNEEPLALTHQGNDEVSILAREFTQIYSRMQEAYRISKDMAEIDSLTRLHNRYTFSQCLVRLLERAQRSKTQLALLYIDLDNFKAVNDSYGHQVGDLLLQEFSQALCSVLRVTDLVLTRERSVARLAGDEFGVLLADVARPSNLLVVCERILKLFEGGFNSSRGRFRISCSIGIAVYPGDGDSAEELTRNADAAMYQAKSHGRDQFQFYSSELADRTRRENAIESELIKQPFDEFTLNYMPIINASDGRVKSVEALLRWHSPNLGFVSPAEFIPIAESRGVFEALDLWVINQALDDTPKLRDIFGEDLIVAVNISSAQLSSGEFFLSLMMCFQSRQLGTRNIQLEITETFAADMNARVEANLNLLKQAGLTLALDDFGTGYTSLSQMVDYPLDVIKIDKSLVDRMVDERRRDMVLSLVDFCKRQGFSVTAEGIETQQQAEELKAAGVDGLQGFYFAKPQPLSEFAKR